MKHSKIYLVIVFFIILNVQNLKAQGVNFGFGSGTELIKLELGYSIAQKYNFGAYFSPGFALAFNTPHSFGVFGRYTFKKNEIFDNQFFTASIRPYLGANIGILHRPAYIDNLSYYSGGTKPAKTQFGGSICGGAEMLYGKKASYGVFFEGHLGQLSNIFQSFTNSFNSALGATTTNEKMASPWGLIVGLRFYFGKSK